jgi:hypothetical protein
MRVKVASRVSSLGLPVFRRVPQPARSGTDWGASSVRAIPTAVCAVRFETRSYPNSLAATHRGFTFYLADPISSIETRSYPN